MLGETGKSVWAAYEADKLSAGDRALVREYARSLDILDRLHDLTMGKRDVWVTIAFDDMGEIQVGVDRILETQIKVQGMAKQLHAEIRQSGIKQADGVADTGPEDVLARRRREKEERERKSG
jgi:hypothetical protein